MKALSILQPWASLIVGGPLAAGVKRTENRGRSLATAARKLVGHRIAIHASKRIDEDAFVAIRDQTFGFDLQLAEIPHAKIKDFPRGAIAGVATLGRVFDEYDVLSDDERRFFTGDHGIRFDDARWLREPITCSGALGFWAVPDDVAAAVEAQLR